MQSFVESGNPLSPHPALPLLQNSPLCRGLSAEEVERVASLLQPVQVAMGEKIVSQGDTGEALFFVEYGQVEVVVNIQDRESVSLARIGPGNHFGEIAFVSGGERIADVVALGPVRLWKLPRQQFYGSIASLAQLHQRLTREAMQRSRSAEHQTTLVEQGAQTAVQAVLDKIMRAELRGLRAADEQATLGFDQILAFYQKARFLYPAKMQELEPRFAKVRETWEGLLRGNNDVFKILCLVKPVQGAISITNSICAFQYAPMCWQIQHLVSAERHGLTGTLLMLLGLADWFRRASFAGCHRFTYRPDNPGVTQLFAHFGDQLGQRKLHTAVFDYLMEPLDKVEAALKQFTVAGLQVESVHSTPAPDAVGLISRQLHPIELSALAFDHAGWDALDARFAAHGLARKRRLLTARDANRQLLGVAVCNLSSEGMNFSFLENALEYCILAPELNETGRRDTIVALLRAGCGFMRASSRDYLACMLDPGLASLMEQLRLRPEKPKQYSVATYSANPDDMNALHQACIRYYRELLTHNL
jgi:CRP-like cAMP-binding protein